MTRHQRIAQVAIGEVIDQYKGCSRAQMERRFVMAMPRVFAGSERLESIYRCECRREIMRLYRNGEGGETLFSELEAEL